MTLEKLLGGHSPEPPSLIIANVLYEGELLESWGQSIKLIMDECRKAGLPAPQYQADVTGAKLIFIYQGNVPARNRPRNRSSSRPRNGSSNRASNVPYPLPV